MTAPRTAIGDLTIRELCVDELPAAWQLGRLAFGGPATPPSAALQPSVDRTRYGAFDGDGRLIGKANDLHHEQWWGGTAVVAADIGGVAVAPEARGKGVARALLTALLAGARDRGAAVSALYPSLSTPYRSAGWEIAGAVRTVDIATADLPRWGVPDGLALRAGDRGDLPALQRLYEAVARHRCGMLTRTRGYDALGDARLPKDADGLTLVESDAGLAGYLLWQRGSGHRRESVLTVREALAVSAPAARALIGVLAGWVSVAPTVRISCLGGDALGAVLPLERAVEHRTEVWMHRPVDVQAAVSDRRWPESVAGSTTFSLADPAAPWNAGTWRLEVCGGHGRLDPAADDGGRQLSVRGFALLYCGGSTARGLAEAGLLRVPAGDSAASLDLLAAGPPARLLDYF